MTTQEKVNVDISYQLNELCRPTAGIETLSQLSKRGVGFVVHEYNIETEEGDVVQHFQGQIEYGSAILTSEQIAKSDSVIELVDPVQEWGGRSIYWTLTSLAEKFENAAKNESVVTFKPLQNGMTKATLWKFNEKTKTYSTESAICDGYDRALGGYTVLRGFVPDSQP